MGRGSWQSTLQPVILKLIPRPQLPSKVVAGIDADRNRLQGQEASMCGPAGILLTLLLCGPALERVSGKHNLQARLRAAASSLLDACFPSGNLPPSLGGRQDM